MRVTKPFIISFSSHIVIVVALAFLGIETTRILKREPHTVCLVAGRQPEAEPAAKEQTPTPKLEKKTGNSHPQDKNGQAESDSQNKQTGRLQSQTSRESPGRAPKNIFKGKPSNIHRRRFGMGCDSSGKNQRQLVPTCAGRGGNERTGCRVQNRGCPER